MIIKIKGEVVNVCKGTNGLWSLKIKSEDRQYFSYMDFKKSPKYVTGETLAVGDYIEIGTEIV